MKTNHLLIILIIINSFFSCNKIEYCLCDNKDEFIRFKADNKSKCYTLNIESGITDNTDSRSSINNGYVTNIYFSDYSKKGGTTLNEDGFSIVLLNKRTGVYNSDSIFAIACILDENEYYFSPMTKLKYPTGFSVELTKVDEVNNIIEGKFHGELYDLNDKQISIDEGSFKVKY
jgi:hypothetical protein